MTIELKNVTRRFGAMEALRDVSLTFEAGKIYGLLGNNGAGKSTMMNLIGGRLLPSAGQVLLDGELAADSTRALSGLFLMNEGSMFPEDMRVQRAFDWAARFRPAFDRAEADALARQFELNERTRVSKLSTGYGSIFKLILALASNADCLLLDEPVLGLDAQHREMFYKLLLEKYAKNGCTVIFSTHLISEAAPLVERAVILRRGRVLRDAPVEELTAGAYTVSGPAAAVDAYLAGRRVLSESAVGGLRSAAVEGEPEDVPAGLEVSGLELQDLYIALMEQEDRK